jgi:diguanylate cyclase
LTFVQYAYPLSVDDLAYSGKAILSVPDNTSTFLLGLTIGSVLLILGTVIGFLLGRKSGAASIPLQGQQFLAFLRTMSQWTAEFSGDVLKYQDQLDHINQKVRSGDAPREELLGMVQQMMDTNRQLHLRLENTEKKLENQTDQLASYLKEARTDGLTGLLNRRAFDKTTDDLFSAWQKKQQAFGIALIDIDHFKQINDNFGHPAGDAVLKQLARMIQSELSNTVCVARYGGEEFGVLSLAPAHELASALDRLRSLISQTPIVHEGKIIPVTLSGGVAQVASGERIGALVRRADEALYASKVGGRNRIHLHDGQVCKLITLVVDSHDAGKPSIPAIPPEVQAEADNVASRIQQRLRRIVEEESQRFVER